jgi:hypothetical protein
MMVFIGYEPGSKDWRFYNLATWRVHVSCDAVFKEDHAWKWDEEDVEDDKPFRMEYVVAGGVRPGVGNDAGPRSPLVSSLMLASGEPESARGTGGARCSRVCVASHGHT